MARLPKIMGVCAVAMMVGAPAAHALEYGEYKALSTSPEGRAQLKWYEAGLAETAAALRPSQINAGFCIPETVVYSSELAKLAIQNGAKSRRKLAPPDDTQVSLIFVEGLQLIYPCTSPP